LVVINHGETTEDARKRRNSDTLALVNHWQREHCDADFSVHTLWYPNLPRKHAGVGLARKLGMDEAVARLNLAGATDGIIVNLDADCLCRHDYLTALERHFESRPATPGCSIRFEHSLRGVEHPALVEGIARYELFLRYYVGALRFTGYPHAFQTVGSAMAVRSSVYQRQGGMNRRQAGEDFYFLGKISRLGGFSELVDTLVYPSARASNRVPFGTGAYLRERLAGYDRHHRVYAPRIFEDLRQFFADVPDFFGRPVRVRDLEKHLPKRLCKFLAECDVEKRISEINANVASPETFEARFFRWFDAFRIYKYVRSVHDVCDSGVAIEAATHWLLEWLGEQRRPVDVNGLLELMRELDSRGWTAPQRSRGKRS